MLLLIKQGLKLLPNSLEEAFIISRSEGGPVVSFKRREKFLILDANFSFGASEWKTSFAGPRHGY